MDQYGWMEYGIVLGISLEGLHPDGHYLVGGYFQEEDDMGWVSSKRMSNGSGYPSGKRTGLG